MNAVVDALATTWFVALFLLTPALGWFFMVVDYRAHLRSLRRAMVAVGNYASTPYWALRERPECLTELGLEPGCTADEVMAAYRIRVKEAHPDRGGDRQRFERLQQRLAEALALVEGAEPGGMSAP